MSNIQIRSGKEYGDATHEYIISLKKPMTVKEFIDEWLQNEDEWGYFRVQEGKQGYFGYPTCSYRYGQIEAADRIGLYYDRVIKEVHGSGGWTRSDFIFTLE